MSAKRKRTSAELDTNFDKKIELADLLLTAERENTKKQKILAIGTFIDQDSEREKIRKEEYKTHTTWKNFFSKIAGELSRRELVNQTARTNKNWKQSQQEYFMDKVRKFNSGDSSKETNIYN